MSAQGSTANVLAALCSFFIPGLGQVYQGRVGKGLLFFGGLYLLFFYGMWMGRWQNVWLPEVLYVIEKTCTPASAAVKV